MSLALTQSFTAVGAGVNSSFAGTGGMAPYTYAVLGGGAGGTINASTGFYLAPAVAPSSPTQAYDTIQVTDSLAATASARILVGTALVLVCDIIQSQMGLSNGRVYEWDQKIFQPSDSGLYVILQVGRCKPFGNVLEYAGGSNLTANQFTTFQATVDIDIISRGPAARDQKELVLMALLSNYSLQQQRANAFTIARVPVGFQNLSFVDGAAIPYRFRISMNMSYSVAATQAVPYMDEFETPELVFNP